MINEIFLPIVRALGARGHNTEFTLMSKKQRKSMQPFGDSTDRSGFWLLLQEHLTWLRVHNYSEATIRKRALYVRLFSLWCLDRDLSQPSIISKPIIESFQRSLYRHRKKDGNPLSWGSQHLHLKEVRAFFAWLVKVNHLPFSPAAEIELPRQPKTLPKAILTADEVEQVLSQPDTTTPLGLRDRAILETFYSTGIRRAELCGLQIDDIQSRSSEPVRQSRQREERPLRADRDAGVGVDRPLRGTSTRQVATR